MKFNGNNFSSRLFFEDIICINLLPNVVPATSKKHDSPYNCRRKMYDLFFHGIRFIHIPNCNSNNYSHDWFLILIRKTRYGIDSLPYDFNPVKYHKTTRHTFLHHQLDIFPTSSFLLHLHINSSQRGYSCETIEGKTVISHPKISPYRFRIGRFPY